MKQVFYLMIALACLASCSSDDDDQLITFTVSLNELTFSPEEGEQVVDIASNADWNCEHQAEWMIVRQQQDRIRVLVEKNASTSQRSDIIKITVNGSVKAQINVTQNGTELAVESRSISVDNNQQTTSVPIQSNANWTVEEQPEWCTAKKDNNNLRLTVERNYKMEERQGTIILHAGEVSIDLTLKQSGCQWFESFEMIDVEAGTFYMGAQKNDENAQNYDTSAYQIENPVHQVSVSAFAIGKFEVTQLQWTAAMGDNPSSIQGEQLPVESVTWEQVQQFISILNEKTGLNYRLPTEAEWEFAAKGGNKTENFRYSGSSVLGSCGWYYSNSDATTHEVGSKDANELGLYDMSGNVREWCNDWFSYYSTQTEDNPMGPSTGESKINRGGSWTTPAVNCRNTYRHTDGVNESSQDLGFRLALTK